MDFMAVIETSMKGVFNLWMMPMQMPQPIGMISMGDIMLFFACCYLIAETVGSVAERRD